MNKSRLVTPNSAIISSESNLALTITIIHLSLQNPNVLMWDDTEVIGYLISKAEPVFWKHRSHKGQDCVGEVLLRWIVPIMGDVTVHDGPEPLDGIEVWAIGRQLDQMNATVFARQERSDIGAFVV